MGRYDIFTERRFFNLLEFVLQKTYDYLILDSDNNEYYCKFIKTSKSSTDKKMTQ